MIAATPVLTAIGKSLLVRAVGGETITFTRFGIGDGWLRDNETPESRMALISEKLSFPIHSRGSDAAGCVSLTGSFDSSDIETDFEWRELGLFCEGEDGAEQLYAYANSGGDAGLLTALKTDIMSEQTITMVVAVGDAEHVTALISPKDQYAAKTDFNAHVANKENPHGVTKEQVGLGNAVNKAPSDMEITYEQPEAPEELESGKTLGVMMGKIAAAVKSLIAHVGNKQNPHSLTADGISAAKKDHKHSAEDVESGVLPLGRGGTGVESLDALRNLIGTNAVMSVYAGDGTAKRLISVGFKPSAVVLCTENGRMGDTAHGVCGGFAVGAYGLRSAASELPAHATTWDDSYTALLITDGGFWVNYYESEDAQARIATNESGTTYLYIAYK